MLEAHYGSVLDLLPHGVCNIPILFLGAIFDFFFHLASMTRKLLLSPVPMHLDVLTLTGTGLCFLCSSISAHILQFWLRGSLDFLPNYSDQRVLQAFVGREVDLEKVDWS